MRQKKTELNPQLTILAQRTKCDTKQQKKTQPTDFYAIASPLCDPYSQFIAVQ